MRRRGELTDQQWERLAPLLPAEKPATGRTNKSQRLVLNGMLWIQRTGAPWRDLPERYGPWETSASRSSRGRKAGTWARTLRVLQQRGAASGRLGWAEHQVDSAAARARQHAAGAPKKGRLRGGTRGVRGGAPAGRSATVAPPAGRSAPTCGGTTSRP